MYDKWQDCSGFRMRGSIWTIAGFVSITGMATMWQGVLANTNAPLQIHAPARPRVAHVGEWERVSLAADVERSTDLAERAAFVELSRWVSSLKDTELARQLAYDSSALGSISLGPPNRGRLFNAVALQESALWTVMNPEYAFGTAETIAGLQRSIERVAERCPDTPALAIGHISREGGGYLRPHRSHQSGRDVDVGYYYIDDAKWYARADAQNLDRVRTWELVKALIEVGNVEFVFVDVSVQSLLKEYALSKGEDAEWLETVVFGGMKKRTPAIVRHEWGHRTHLHARFRSELATSVGTRASRYFANGRFVVSPRS